MKIQLNEELSLVRFKSIFLNYLTRITLIKTVFLARSQSLIILTSSSKDVNIREFSHREIDTHMRVSFSVHVLEFLKLQS